MLQTRSVEDLRQLLVNFANTSGLALANQLFPLLVEYDLDLHTYLETKTATEFESESKASLEAHLQELYKLSVYKKMQTCKSVLSLE